MSGYKRSLQLLGMEVNRDQHLAFAYLERQGQRFGVSHTTIRQILEGRMW